MCTGWPIRSVQTSCCILFWQLPSTGEAFYGIYCSTQLSNQWQREVWTHRMGHRVLKLSLMLPDEKGSHSHMCPRLLSSVMSLTIVTSGSISYEHELVSATPKYTSERTPREKMCLHNHICSYHYRYLPDIQFHGRHMDNQWPNEHTHSSQNTGWFICWET